MDQPDLKTPAGFWREAETLGRALADCLEYYEALGLEGLPPRLAPPPPAGRPAAAGPSPASANQARRPAPANFQPAGQAEKKFRPAGPAGKKSGPSGPAEENGPETWAPEAADLKELERLIGQCRACPLARDRAEEPFAGRGSARPLLVVVGPTPAMAEGPEGQLLTAMIEKGLKLDPADYYLTGLVKCRPRDDDQPLERADGICRPILWKQLALLAPKTVLALGKKPGQRLSGLAGEPLGLLRPRTHKVIGLEHIWLKITYGLEDILASPEIKAAVWQDLLQIRPGLLKLKELRSGSNSGD